MSSNEISLETFEKAVKSLYPVEDKRKTKHSMQIPIHYTNYDDYESYNRIEEVKWTHSKDEEEKEKEIQGFGPPKMPEFNKKRFKRDIIPIEKLLFEPGRNERAEKICIFIRGAPGSGKSFLADKILQHERKSGSERAIFCTPNRYYANGTFGKDKGEKYMNNLQSEVQDLINEGFYTFIIVEFEGAKLEKYQYLAKIAKETGFSVYGIDINQEIEICKKYLKHNRFFTSIGDIIKEILDNPVPYDVGVLDPTEFIDPDWKKKQPPPPKPSSPKKEKSCLRGYSDSDESSDEDCFSCY